MKLTKKLLLIISASLAGALLAVSILAIWQMRSQSISRLLYTSINPPFGAEYITY